MTITIRAIISLDLYIQPWLEEKEEGEKQGFSCLRRPERRFNISHTPDAEMKAPVRASRPKPVDPTPCAGRRILFRESYLDIWAIYILGACSRAALLSDQCY